MFDFIFVGEYLLSTTDMWVLFTLHVNISQQMVNVSPPTVHKQCIRRRTGTDDYSIETAGPYRSFFRRPFGAPIPNLLTLNLEGSALGAQIQHKPVNQTPAGTAHRPGSQPGLAPSLSPLWRTTRPVPTEPCHPGSPRDPVQDTSAFSRSAI